MLSDSATTAVLTRLPAGEWTQLSAVPSAVEDGFDTLDVVWVCDFRATEKTAIQVAAAWPLGTRYGTSEFWLRTAVPERLGGNVWRVRASYAGRISEDKPVHSRRMSTNEVFSIDSLTYLGYEDVPANVREASPSVQIGYVLIGESPPTGLVGLAGTPAVAPSVRASFWSLFDVARINFPSGWIFTDIDTDDLAGTDTPVHYCRETWQYFHERLPV